MKKMNLICLWEKYLLSTNSSQAHLVMKDIDPFLKEPLNGQLHRPVTSYKVTLDVPAHGLAQARAQALGNSCVTWSTYSTSLGLHAICYKKMINSISKDYG